MGDTKTPADWHFDGICYLDVAAQRQQFGAYADVIPYRHYCRKNLGYLYAIRHGAQVILETDDDNFPYEDVFGLNLEREVSGPVDAADARQPADLDQLWISTRNRGRCPASSVRERTPSFP